MARLCLTKFGIIPQGIVTVNAAEWLDLEVTSWEVFRDVGTYLANNHGHSLSRGQEDESWGLMPSLPRLLRDNGGVTEPVAWEIEKQVAADFMDMAPPYETDVQIEWPRPSAPRVSWWPIMQHYDAPTRLLDWTHSLCVAAYFAVEKESADDKDGAVYWFNWRALSSHVYHNHLDVINRHRRDAETFCDASLAPFVYTMCESIFINPRARIQQSRFTISGRILSDHSALLARGASEAPLVTLSNHNFPETVSFTRARFIIPRALKPTFRRELDALGFTRDVLYSRNDHAFTALIGAQLKRDVPAYIHRFNSGARAVPSKYSQS